MVELTKYLDALKNTKTRTLVLVLGAGILAGSVYLVSNLGGKSDATAQAPSKTVEVPSSIKAIPGNPLPEKYRELQQEENLQRAEEAKKKNASAIPTIIGQTVDAGANAGAAGGAAGKGQNVDDLFGDTSRGGFIGTGLANPQDAQKAAEDERQRRLQEQRDRLAQQAAERDRQKELERLQREAEAAQKAYQQQVQETANQMANYAKGATAGWTGTHNQTYVQGVFGNEAAAKATAAEKGGKEGATTTVATNTTETSKTTTKDTGKSKISKSIVKAGTVYFGVLDTAINSDEPGPVLATIVQGKLKGAKLLGTIELPPNAEKVLIKFNQLSLPGKAESIGINAFAIDPDTARTAMGSDVDHHYLLRYGTLFASSFMEGFGKAISQSGSTVTTFPTGNTQTANPVLSTKQQVEVALGTVGEKFGKQLEPIFNRPITVYVDQGLGVGILFMKDADITPDEDQKQGGKL